MIDFELIKGRIQKHRLSSIVTKSLELLNEVQRRDDKAFPFWNILVLIRWAYLYTTDSPLRKPIQPHEFDQLCTLIRDFEVEYAGLNFKSKREVNQSMRIIAYQQFPHQEKFHNSILSRQLVIYTKLQGKFNIPDEFEKLTGIKLKSFLEYSYFTFFFFNFDKLGKDTMRYEGDLFESYFTLFKSKWSVSELRKFLTLISITNKSHFENLQRLTNERLQLYETNFFITKPLIYFRGQYRIAHRCLFVQTLKHFIYNYLKQNHTQFPEEFGKYLERYLQLGLRENNISFATEKELKVKYPITRVADFCLEDNILIESKAIELHPRTGVMRTKDLLEGDLNTTIIKAYTQLLSTAAAIDATKEWWGIIVTYKEMYIGFGDDAWIEFMSELVQKFCSESNINLSILPPQNLCFISIDDWDYMMQVVKDGKATIRQMLEKATELNSSPDHAEKILLFDQALQKHFRIKHYTLKYLADVHLELDIIPDKDPLILY